MGGVCFVAEADGQRGRGAEGRQQHLNGVHASRDKISYCFADPPRRPAVPLPRSE
jgi:hypothetical protein